MRVRVYDNGDGTYHLSCNSDHGCEDSTLPSLQAVADVIEKDFPGVPVHWRVGNGAGTASSQTQNKKNHNITCQDH